MPGAECPTIAQRVACFSGSFCPGAAISVHVSMARFWAGKGEVKPLFTSNYLAILCVSLVHDL